MIQRLPIDLLHSTLGGIILLGGAQACWADGVAEGPVASAAQVSEVIVTGTKASNVKALDASSPIDVVGADKLAAYGTNDLNGALQQLLPSVNFQQVTIGSAAGANLNITLRGLAPDQNLVLINGERDHKSAFVNVKPGSARGTEAVDLATLPTSAIDHVEVLRDAAAAQYGSDAIAGVVNIVLRKASDGGSLGVQSGQWQDGDGFTTYLHGWKGLPFFGNGYLTVAFDAGYAGDTNQFTSPETRRYYFPGDPREATVNKEEFSRGQPDVLGDYRVAANAGGTINDNLTYKAFATFADKRTRIDGNALLPNADATLRSFYPDGVRPSQWVFSTDDNIGGSLDYAAGAFGDVTLSLTYGENRQTYKTTHSDNASLGLASPTDFYTGALYTNQLEAQLGDVKDVSIPWFAGPITLSAGVDWRREGFSIGAGAPSAYANGGVPILDGVDVGKPAPFGSNTWQAYIPTDVSSISRNVTGVYASAEGKLTDKLRVSLNGRGEDYSDFGSVATGEGSARYDFTPGFALRGSVSSGVRAPSLGQVGYSFIQTTTITNNTNLYEIKTFQVNQPVAIALGAAPLKPETSLNLSGGAVLRFLRTGSLTVDAYQISIRNRITLSDNFTGAAVQTLLDQAGFPQAVGANFFTNALDTRTRGVSLSGAYRYDFGGWGEVGVNLGADVNKTDVTRIRSVDGKVPVGRQTIGYLTEGTPDKKIILGGDWARGPWKVALTGILYGHYKQLDASNPALDQTFHNQSVLNASVNYALTPHIGLSLGADNLFASTPDPISTWAAAGGLPSSPLNPVNWDGRFVWGRITFTL